MIGKKIIHPLHKFEAVRPAAIFGQSALKSLSSQGGPRDAAVRIEFYNSIARFLCHSTALLYSPTSLSDRSNAQITHSTLIFTAVRPVTWDTVTRENHAARPVKATMIVNMWLFYSAKKCYKLGLRSLTLLAEHSISSVTLFVTHSLTNVGLHITNSN